MVISSEEVLCGGSWSVQVFQRGCGGLAAELVSEEKEEGLKTSREPRGSLGNDGLIDDFFGDLSDCSIAS